MLVLAEMVLAYLRQVIQVAGTQRQANRLESNLLDKVMCAEAGELERLGVARLLHLFTTDLAKVGPLEVYMMTELVHVRTSPMPLCCLLAVSVPTTSHRLVH